jgi:hypothetical protein
MYDKLQMQTCGGAYVGLGLAIPYAFVYPELRVVATIHAWGLTSAFGESSLKKRDRHR